MILTNQITNEQRRDIMVQYNKERNVKRLVYRVLKYCVIEMSTSEIEKEIRGYIGCSYADGFKMEMTYEEYIEICKNLKNILFELQKLEYIVSEVKTNVKAHFKAGANRRGDNAYKYTEYQVRLWRSVK